jgi:hypothetical protein
MPISEVVLIGSVASLVLRVEELRKVLARYMIKHKKDIKDLRLPTD